MHMPFSLFQVDSFTTEPFRGNPAGVCLLSDDLDKHHCQAIASEMNCSETAFLLNKGDHFSIRYFTPTQEVNLCGHATLAAAHILWEQNRINSPGITFKAKQEVIAVEREDEWIKMSFPKDSLSDKDLTISPECALGFSDGIVRISKSEIGWYLIETRNEDLVRRAKPDFRELSASETIVLVTSRSQDSSCDFVSRFFAPHVGINEDPVTGYAHTTLGEYWSAQLGKNDLLGCQLSTRGGIVRVKVGKDRNYIMGRAVTVFEAKMKVTRDENVFN